jgi:hypothetical protein
MGVYFKTKNQLIMNQTDNWTLRQIELLHRQLQEHKELNCEEDKALEVLSQLQQQERDIMAQSQGSRASQIMLSIQQMSDVKELRDNYLSRRQTLLANHQRAEQLLQQEIQLERVQQN